jgi:hypothetical protein
MHADELPIPLETWKRLVDAKEKARWARYGVFATARSPDYEPGKKGSLLYVGKSLGPRAWEVKSCDDLHKSSAASQDWLLNRGYDSPFWKFIEEIKPGRQIAWTNVCKMDGVYGTKREDAKRPTNDQFVEVSKSCSEALCDEIRFLKPHVTLFVTGRDYFDHIFMVLNCLNYRESHFRFWEDATSSQVSGEGRIAVITNHPDWYRYYPARRATAIQAIRTLLGSNV